MNDSPPPPPFTPVPVRARRDGLSPARQAALLAALVETRSITQACRRIGCSREALYKLWRRADAASFRTACDAVLNAPKPVRAAPVRTRSSKPLGAARAPAMAPHAPVRPAYSLEAFRSALAAGRRSR